MVKIKPVLVTHSLIFEEMLEIENRLVVLGDKARKRRKKARKLKA